MAGTKFKINPETLLYEPIKKPFWKKALFVGLFFACCAIVVVIGYLLVFQFVYETPREKELKREYSQLHLQLKSLNTQLDSVSYELTGLKEKDNIIYKAILGGQQIPDEIWEAGFGGSEKYKDLEKLKDGEILIKTNEKLEKLNTRVNIQKKSYDQLISLAVDKEKMLQSVPSVRPIADKDLRRIASGWGMRIHPIYKIPKLHEGIDFTAIEGTEVYATGDGVIENARYSKTYGNVITIDHGYGIKSHYAHLSGFNVKKRQKVKRQEVIGFVGNSGQSVGDHLHYEVEVNGKKVNPINYFFNDVSPKDYDLMVKRASSSKQSLD